MRFCERLSEAVVVHGLQISANFSQKLKFFGICSFGGSDTSNCQKRVTVSQRKDKSQKKKSQKKYETTKKIAKGLVSSKS